MLAHLYLPPPVERWRKEMVYEGEREGEGEGERERDLSR
jgi:hypothetical protein